MPPLCKGRGTAKRLSETLKIQAEGAGFLAKSNLCSSEAELGGIDRRKLSKSKLTRVNPLSHGVPPCQLPLLMGASRLCANILFCIVQEVLSDGKDKNERCTSASLHLLEGEGDRVAVEGVNNNAKDTFNRRNHEVFAKKPHKTNVNTLTSLWFI